MLSPTELSTPTTSTRINVRSGVHGRSGFWGSKDSVLGVYSDGGAADTLSISRSLVDELINGNSAPTDVEP